MIVTYDVAGETQTLHVESVSMEDALSLIPDHGHLEWVQYE